MADEQAQAGEDFPPEASRETRRRKVEIEMLAETYRDALRLAREAGWDEGEALLSVFAIGVAHLRVQIKQAQVMDGRATHTSAMQELAERCAHLEAMCTTLKSRASSLAKVNQALQARVASLQAEVQHLQEENRKG